MKLTRLEKTLYRLQSQHAVLAHVFEHISGQDGPVFEIGLGLGRTYNHLRHHLPGRPIYAFDRKAHAYEDCMPPAEWLIEGELSDTLPLMSTHHAGKVVLAHVDIGSFDREQNRRIASFLATQLPSCLAPGGYVASDLPIESDQLPAQPLPAGARDGSIHFYRYRG